MTQAQAGENTQVVLGAHRVGARGGNGRFVAGPGSRQDAAEPGRAAKLLHASLPRDPTCGTVARSLLTQAIGHLVDEQGLDDARLIASELANNAYLHGVGAIELRIYAGDNRLRIEVVDEGQGAAIGIRQHPLPHAGGHGLRLVETLSLAWGAHEGTTHVWAEVPGRSRPA